MEKLLTQHAKGALAGLIRFKPRSITHKEKIGISQGTDCTTARSRVQYQQGHLVCDSSAPSHCVEAAMSNLKRV